MSWWTHSESDPRWNASLASSSPAKWIAFTREDLGEPPSDLEWGYSEPPTANNEHKATMDIHIYDHYGLCFEALSQPPDGETNYNRIKITQRDSAISLWLTKEQADELRRALDTLYPPTSTSSDSDEAVDRYGDDHKDELTAMGGGE